MNVVEDLFPGFVTESVQTPRGRFFTRRGGSGAPLLLLHGYPQTHVEWHKVAGQLAARFTVILMDLRGYGMSEPAATCAQMEKRSLGEDAVAVMHALGYERFSLVGHDRGGRVAYRLAFDQPERLQKCVVIDIIPTAAMFEDMGRVESALRKYHWLFLAQPHPFPETMIGAAPLYFLDHTLASWTAAKDLSAFHPTALKHYREAFALPGRIHASCNDYRAGAEADRVLDEEDLAAARKISVPLFALWGDKGIPASGLAPLEIWRKYASNVTGKAVASGHFVPEENPQDCARALLEFLS